MLRLDLGELGRRGTLRLDVVVPADDPLWEGSEFDLRESVKVRLHASQGAAEQIVVRGKVATALGTACRRCLGELVRPMELELLAVMVPGEDGAGKSGEEEPRDESLHLYDPGARELDLGDIIREELVLAVPAWPVCRPDCRGLCPRCGTDLNESVCTCARDESDPRWAALRALRPEE